MIMSNIGEPEKDVAAEGHQSHEDMAHRPIWEVIDEIMLHVPEAILSRLPIDGSERHDHYLYGRTRKLHENHEARFR
jgi:hypothetical protein